MSTPLLVATKPLVLFQSISLADVSLIQTMILQDEGGWVLTSYGGDNDGGWTYGGMTRKLFESYFGNVPISTVATLSGDLSTSAEFRRLVICVYYKEFVVPLRTGNISPEVFPAAFSCAVNCGKGGYNTVKGIWQVSKNLTQRGFCDAWKEHYFQLLKGNPAYINVIHGWVNRVWRYL